MRSVLILALVLSTGLVACGKKGDLQPPPAKGETVEKPRSLF